ncbi:MAG: ABC transporter substrate-binding protein [bacterium]
MSSSSNRKAPHYSIMSIIFLCLIAGLAVYFNMHKPRIMILHSYTPDYVWTRDVNEGIQRVAENWGRYSVQWHYMDTKKHRDQRWYEQASLIAKRAIENASPDVLIIVDDLAQKLVGKYYVNHPNMQIVFAGVNGSIEQYGYQQANNVTGIFERKQLNAIKETLLTLEQGRENPLKNPRVLYLIDSSTSLSKGRPYFEKFDWSPLKFEGVYVMSDFEQWQQEVACADRMTDYLLVANYRKLKTSATDNKIPAPKTVMTWTEEHSPVPVIGVNLFNTEEGAMMSIGVSPYEQGEIAAKMAERIIEEKVSANNIPMRDNKHYVVALNDEALTKRGITMPSIYEAFGRATAHYYEAGDTWQ